MAVRVKYDFNPLAQVDVRLTSDEKDDLLERISNYVLESVLSDVGSARSPVTGKPFEKLSKEYANKVGRKVATLELTGDLLDSLKIERKRNTLRLTVPDEEQGKADGHNNFSGESPLPERKFIPDADNGESFTPEILGGIKDIIDEFIQERDGS